MKRQSRTLLLAFLVLTFVWLFGAGFLDMSYDPDDALMRTKLMLAKALEGFDLEAVNSPKAVLIDSILNCVLKPLDNLDNEAGQERLNLSRLTGAVKIAEPRTLRRVISKLQKELSEKQSIISFLAEPIINQHDFGYIHNASDACAGDDIDFLFVVPSASDYFERRERSRHRELYQFTKEENHRSKLMFFLGRPKSPDIQSKIDAESEKFGDIVQENFEDVYKNIRYKAVSMLRWASTFCRRAKFVIRTDDDIRIDIRKVLSTVWSKSLHYTDFILGERKDDGGPMRNPKHKWYVSREEYPNGTYPPYAYGALLAYPISTVSLLFQAALRVSPIWMEDVYLTGICGPKVGVPILHHPDFVFEHEVY